EVSCTAREEQALRSAVGSALDLGKGVLHALTSDGTVEVFSSRRSCPQCGRGFPEPDPRLLSFNSSQGWCEGCFGLGVRVADLEADQGGEEPVWSEAAVADEGDSGAGEICEHCHGARLNPVARHLRLREHSISELTAMSAIELSTYLKGLRLSERERA